MVLNYSVFFVVFAYRTSTLPLLSRNMCSTCVIVLTELS